MLRSNRAQALAVVALVPQLALAAPSRIEQARKALNASAQAYRAVAGMKEVFTYVVTGPNADRKPKRIEIRLGAGTDASISDGFIQAVAMGKQFFVTKSDAPTKYVERPFAGDFGKALSSIFGGAPGPFEPVQIAMRSGKNIDEWLEALRFNLLEALRIVNFARTDGDRPFDQIEFTAQNGRLELGLDGRTHFLSSVHLWVEPPGSSGNPLVEITGEFSREVVADASTLVVFNPGNRQPIADAANLDSESLPTGTPAPAFVLESTTGSRVSLADFRDRVVILDFWATWCVPCWHALRETQEVADWASPANLPVKVLAVNTMEQSKSEQQRKKQVVDFLASQRLSMTCLLDQDAQVFSRFGSPGLPSVVVVGPDGKIAKYHQGAVPNLSATLKQEVTKALGATTQP